MRLQNYLSTSLYSDTFYGDNYIPSHRVREYGVLGTCGTHREMSGFGSHEKTANKLSSHINS